MTKSKNEKPPETAETPNNSPLADASCSTFVRTFQPRFARLVEDGKKLQTVRKTPKRMPKAGDIIDAREWTGKPYRSKQRKLGKFRIIAVESVEIRTTGVMVDGALRIHPLDDEFARADGFENFKDMTEWFCGTHELPFKGILISWSNSPY